MPVPESVYTPKDGGIFVQKAPGKTVYYLGACYDLGDMSSPRGGRSTIWCMDENRVWRSIGSESTPPGDTSLQITGIQEKTADWLERFVQTNCPFIIHTTLSKCGTRGLMPNWERAFSYEVYQINDDTLQNVTMREPSGVVTRQFDMDVNPTRIDSRLLSAERQTTSDTENALDVWACDPQCIGDCGEEIEVGQHAQVGTDGTASPSTTGDVLFTTDLGVTWTAGATLPFATGEAVMSGWCFAVDKDTVRTLVVRDTDAGAPLEIAYSDDAGATWTNVVVGATNGEAATGPQSLFVIGLGNIWLVTDEGEVFFSSDGGVTWAAQGAIGVSGANPLNAIHFITTNIGYAVGDSDTIISTVDGGATWAAATATGGGGDLDTVQTFNQYEIIVGDDGGEIFKTWDGTTSWTTLYTSVGAIACLSFSTVLTGLMIHNTAAPIGTVFHTVDGGFSWRELEGGTPDNVGLNSVVMLTPTAGYAVGNAEGGTAVILQIGG